MTGPEAYFDESNLGDYSTFGIRYLLLPVGHAPPVPATLIARSGPYELYTVNTSSGLVQVVEHRGFDHRQCGRHWRPDRVVSAVQSAR